MFKITTNDVCYKAHLRTSVAFSPCPVINHYTHMCACAHTHKHTLRPKKRLDVQSISWSLSDLKRYKAQINHPEHDRVQVLISRETTAWQSCQPLPLPVPESPTRYGGC